MRHLMGVVTSLVIVGVVALQAAFGVLPERAAIAFAAMALAGILVFAASFGSGFNRRCADPSLTGPQILWAGISTTVLVYQAGAARGLMIPFYLMALLFGSFRLTMAQLLSIGAAFTLGDGLATALALWTAPTSADAAMVRREFMQWCELAVVMMWFAWMGGYVSQLRSRVQAANADLKRALQKIEIIATYDELTGLSNRRTIREILARERKRSERAGQPLCVAMIDADHFKRINDDHGHAAGDAVLKGLADTMRRALRDSDSVGRYGGEEFLVVLPMTDADQARIPLERIRAGVAAMHCEALPPAAGVTVSIGVAQWRADEDVDEAIRRADTAVYRAKHSGRNRIVCEVPVAG